MKSKLYIAAVLAIVVAALCFHILRQPAAQPDIKSQPAEASRVTESDPRPASSPFQATDKASTIAENSTPAVGIPTTAVANANPTPLVASVVVQSNAPAAAPLDEAAVRSQVIRLGNLSLESDSGSLNAILTELTNANKIVREAALDAAMDFGSKDAAPGLRAAAATVEDPYEKVALLEAADFVELPSFLDIVAERNPNGVKRTNASRLGSRGVPIKRPAQ